MEELARRYWGIKCLLRWWQDEVRDFEEDFKRVKFLLPKIAGSAESESRKRNSMIAQRLPQLDEELKRLEDELQNSSDYRQLIEQEPERIKPLYDLAICRETDAPDFVKDFIGGELCTEEQMETAVECLISSFTTTLGSSQPIR